MYRSMVHVRGQTLILSLLVLLVVLISPCSIATVTVTAEGASIRWAERSTLRIARLQPRYWADQVKQRAMFGQVKLCLKGRSLPDAATVLCDGEAVFASPPESNYTSCAVDRKDVDAERDVRCSDGALLSMCRPADVNRPWWADCTNVTVVTQATGVLKSHSWESIPGPPRFAPSGSHATVFCGSADCGRGPTPTVQQTVMPSELPKAPARDDNTTEKRSKLSAGLVRGADLASPEVRQAWLTFIEVNSKMKGMIDMGVRTKEVFAMVVDNIANFAPEIVVQLVCMLIKIPLITLIGQLLSASLPDVLVPNSGSTPGVPVVPGIEPVKPAPPPPCKCQGGAQFSQEASLLETAAGCDCDEPTTATAADAPHSFSFDVDDFPMHTAFLQTAAKIGRNRGPMEGGGANGGPLAKMEPKLRDAIMDGLLSNCMPQLQQEISTKLVKAWPMVKHSVWREATRSLSHSVTREVTQGLVDALLAKLFKGLTRRMTQLVTAGVTVGLTHSLSATITHSLTRSPKVDFYCYYCKQFRLYCDLCREAAIKDFRYDYYLSYYSSYYSTYFATYYGGPISTYFANKRSAGHG